MTNDETTDVPIVLDIYKDNSNYLATITKTLIKYYKEQLVVKNRYNTTQNLYNKLLLVKEKLGNNWISEDYLNEIDIKQDNEQIEYENALKAQKRVEYLFIDTLNNTCNYEKDKALQLIYETIEYLNKEISNENNMIIVDYYMFLIKRLKIKQNYIINFTDASYGLG